MTAAARFTQSDVKRAMAGAKAAGFTRVRVMIDPLGNITADASNDAMPASTQNPWDSLLKP